MGGGSRVIHANEATTDRSTSSEDTMEPNTLGGDNGRSSAKATKLSYKFQRLRERLRAAIASGELCGKLPGERQLARRFRANAKTLSKALTDLAAEGLLERSIGRGTFVKGSVPQSASQDKWLLVCSPDDLETPLVNHLLRENPQIQVATDTSTMRPSFLNPFRAVITFDKATPEEFLRDLVVRNLTVVLVGREPSTYSTHAVLVDRTLGAARVAREMLTLGHRRFFVVHRADQPYMLNAVRQTAQRFDAGATVDGGNPQDVLAAVEAGATAIICDSRKDSVVAKQRLERAGIDIPGRVSFGAVGSRNADVVCSGYYVNPIDKANAVLQLLRDPQSQHRPTTLWLTGQYIDCGTIAQAGEMAGTMAYDSEDLSGGARL
jgi:GntR family transcriptional regulator